MKKLKKQALTLLEIMVVIFIIGIIGAVVGVNMRGSLDKGKAFKSEKGSRQVYDIVTLEAAKDGRPLREINTDRARDLLSRSGLTRDANKLIQDGWGTEYDIYFDQAQQDIRIYSAAFINYLRNSRKMEESEIAGDFPWLSTVAPDAR